MARNFEIPVFYRSPIIATLKAARRAEDRLKKDLAPSVLDLGEVVFKLGRHFGFCYGVENAIEIAYRAISENPDRRVFLLSEMIHNPQVNADLVERGVRFIMQTDGTRLIPLDDLRAEDIVIVPAFGTTVELFEELAQRGIDPRVYNTTCPFVEKVWNRSASLGDQGFTVVIHGRHRHEETRATFSHARLSAPCLIIRDLPEAHILADFLRGNREPEEFQEHFAGRVSEGFDPERHLNRIGVVNQTTMLATETQAISNLLREAMRERYGDDSLNEHFADTRDTLCYATAENQAATRGLIESGGDLDLVVGGYNSSNTSHLDELLEQVMPTYYIKDAGEVQAIDRICHLDLHSGNVQTTSEWLPGKRPVEILITAGASCPDALVDQVIQRVAELTGVSERIDPALESFREIASRSAES